MSIKLFIIATPIGNLSDLSDRARNVLKEVDLIFAEDTRVSMKLLYHLGLKTRMVSCHKFNEQSRVEILKAAFDDKLSVALVSDAGTPLVSDPGERIVKEAIEIGFEICAIPGPTACIQALIGSGLPADRFAFEGFLPDKKSQMKKRLEEVADDPRTQVFYLSCHGLLKKLALFAEVLGPRKACLAKELTKIHEKYFRDTLDKLPQYLNEENLKGEFTLVVEGNTGQSDELDQSALVQHIDEQFQEGVSVNDIAKSCQKKFGIRKSDAYSLVLEVVGKRKA